MKQAVPRLIHQFKPKKYTLSIDQNSESMLFSGSVTVDGYMPEKSNILSLHSDGLNITEAKINGQTVTVDYKPKEQIIELNLSEHTDGKVSVSLNFDGKITNQMHGLYPCYFTNNGQEKRLLATQFESHHAREVFPCIDEPEAKAIFELSLTTFKDDVVVSNMPISTEVVKGKHKTTLFEDTPVMSTYILAWVSGDLTYQETITRHGVKVRAYCTPVHTGKTEYGLEIACRALDFMDDYFAIPYPLKKCDIIALPDFAAGAMENWGCITFRESAMLIDKDHSDLSDKQHVANVVTHELAHQWFGNLVTMRWWEDLWLNEGFASWIPYLVIDNLFPEWNIWEQFSTGDLMIGLRADALKNTHPIVVEINNPDEIRSAFDSISYDKGCSVINLLYHYIGPSAFQTGLQNYLKEFAYSNAETVDLWRSWSLSSGRDVEKFMRFWTTEEGFPLIKATANGSGLALSQERFYLNNVEDKDTTLWPIPLMQSAVDTSVFSVRSTKISTNDKLNKGQSGFYRVIYDPEATSKILTQNPDPIDLLGLINDAAEAAKAGYHSTTEALNVLKEVNKSQSEPLFSVALGELASVRMVLSETFEKMKPFVDKFISFNLNRLGIEKQSADTIDDELLRPMVLANASYSGNENIVKWALDYFSSAKSPEDIRPEIRSVVYNTAVREIGDSAIYEKLFSWYSNNTIPGEQITLAGALTGFKDPELIGRTLGYIITDKVKLQDSLYWIAYSLGGRHSKDLAWEWVKSNWEWVGKNFGKEKEIDYYLRYAANGFATEEHLKDYIDFFNTVDIYGSKRAFEQGKETISWQTAWKNRDTQAVLSWLNSQ